MSARSKAAIGAGAGLGATVLFAPAAQAANIEVTSLADDGSGGTTLREAIIQANGNGEADVITFASGLSGTIALVSDLEVVDEAVEIRGPGANLITVDGQDGDNVFYLFSFDEPNTPVTISGLTVTGGSDAYGGGIESRDGTDEAPALTLANVVVTGNEASSGGGGVYASFGSLTITDSVVSNNDALPSGTGGGVFAVDSEGNVRIERSVISGNDAAQAGGAFAYRASGTVTVVDSTFANNTALYGGGGGTFYDNDGQVTISRSTFAGNTAGAKGGGFILWGNNAAVLVENTTVSGNTAGTVAGYEGNGGGLYSFNRDTGPVPDVDTERTIRNSTIVGNQASDSGGGIQAYLYDEDGGPGDILKLSSTIVANNTAPEEPDLGDNDLTDPRKGTFELGFSLIENTGDAAISQNPAGSNLLGLDPALGPLADNGGRTQTHAPSFTSPVIDKGVGNGLATDQRGASRTFDASNFANAAGGDGTDIGAVELLPRGLSAAQCKGKTETVLFAPGAPIVGSDANDVIVGTDAKDSISSGKGKDTVCAGRGNDSVKAGAGKDKVFGQAGKDRLKGNGGNDKLSGNAGRDTLKGGGGKDTLKGGGGKDKLVGGPGKDKLRGGGGKDSERQ